MLLRDKYPDHVPVCLIRDSKRADTPPLDRYKFLISKDMTVGHFMHVIRKRLTMKSDKALYILVHKDPVNPTDAILPPASRTMVDLYEEMCAKDGILYATYALEATFG
jgi:GABA(A) receptor-associated protein